MSWKNKATSYKRFTQDVGISLVKKSKMILYLFWALGFSLIYIFWYLSKPKGRVYISIVINNIMRGYKLEMIQYVMAQARHESNNFQSDLFKRAYNIFGMKIATKRKQRGLKGQSNGYAVYKSCFWSVYDFYERVQQFDATNNLFKGGDSVLLIGREKAPNVGLESYKSYVYATIFKGTNYFEDSVNTYAKRIHHWMTDKQKSDKIEFYFMSASSVFSITMLIIYIISFIKKRKGK